MSDVDVFYEAAREAMAKKLSIYRDAAERANEPLDYGSYQLFSGAAEGLEVAMRELAIEYLKFNDEEG